MKIELSQAGGLLNRKRLSSPQRRFIGIEIDAAYFNAAHKRIKKAEEEQKRRIL